MSKPEKGLLFMLALLSVVLCVAMLITESRLRIQSDINGDIAETLRLNHARIARLEQALALYRVRD